MHGTESNGAHRKGAVFFFFFFDNLKNRLGPARQIPSLASPLPTATGNKFGQLFFPTKKGNEGGGRRGNRRVRPWGTASTPSLLPPSGPNSLSLSLSHSLRRLGVKLTFGALQPVGEAGADRTRPDGGGLRPNLPGDQRCDPYPPAPISFLLSFVSVRANAELRTRVWGCRALRVSECALEFGD